MLSFDAAPKTQLGAVTEDMIREVWKLPEDTGLSDETSRISRLRHC
jgi:hypothetical protein